MGTFARVQVPELMRQGSPRWYTAIPLTYREGESFWTRDAGLLCEGLRAVGVDARFVCFGNPPGERSDLPLILATQEELSSAAWWRRWNLDGVLIISWALPQFEPIVRAIRSAGIKVVLKMDTDGILTPHVWFRRYVEVRRAALRDQGRAAPGIQGGLRTLYSYFFARRQNRSVVKHLEWANLITLESPLARERYGRGLTSAGGGHLLGKIRLLPHPVADHFRWIGQSKKNRIAAVGRWDAYIKGAPLLMEVLGRVLSEAHDWDAVVIGPGTSELEALRSGWQPSVASRIRILGERSSREVASALQEASIAINTSHSESFGISMAEALACGATIVGSAEMAAMNWFASDRSGTLAATRHVGLFCDALRAEVRHWRDGERDPVHVANTWGRRVRTSEVARQLLELSEKEGETAKEGMKQ